MRLPVRSLPRIARRLVRGPLVFIRRGLGRVPLGAVGRRLRRGRLDALGHRLGSGRLGDLARRLGGGRLGALGRRLGGGQLGVLGRRLGRGQRAGIVALAAAAGALGMGAGSSHDDGAKRSTLPVGGAQAADEPRVGWAAAAVRRMAERGGRRPRRGGREHYRRTARKRVPAATAAEFLPLYREAERVYSVNWRLLASIHRQETAFSTAPTTYRGLNDFGCCAGPMQFNVTNGPPSTWESYRKAFRDGRRPKRYPHRTRRHPSIYDDFDAIMAAGSLLRDSGAGLALDIGSWGAAYDYYGHDLFGVDYANQVLARAEKWQRDGFCPNCGIDEGLVAEFDGAYGTTVRRELLAAERREKEKKTRDKAGRRDLEARLKRERERAADRARRRGSKRPSAKRERRAGSPRRPPRRRSGPAKPPPAPAPPPPAATPPPTTTPAPAPDECNAVRKLLGCKPPS